MEAENENNDLAKQTEDFEHNINSLAIELTEKRQETENVNKYYIQ